MVPPILPIDRNSEESVMGIRCTVFVDGSSTGEIHTFPAVPRAGDSIQITGDPQKLTVEQVLHIAEGAVDNSSEGGVHIEASTKKLGA